jgi:hypothetical protein
MSRISRRILSMASRAVALASAPLTVEEYEFCREVQLMMIKVVTMDRMVMPMSNSTSEMPA